MQKKKSPQQSPSIPFFKAVLWIVLSTVLISGSGAIALSYYRHLRNLRIHDDNYRVIAIVQTGPEKEALKTVYLAELLDLSTDKPTNLYRIDTAESEKKLLSSSVIKEAKVKKIPPGTLYIDYTVRQPIGYLGDYKNAAIDSEGVIFPFKPFFTPKRLPVIVLGEFSLDHPEDEPLPSEWGQKIKGPRGRFALDLLDILTTYCCSKETRLARLDVSKATASSNGQREIVVLFEDLVDVEKNGESILRLCPRLLRLSPDNYRQEIANYMVLRENLNEREKHKDAVAKDPTIIIDLRLPHLAFIKEEK